MIDDKRDEGVWFGPDREEDGDLPFRERAEQFDAYSRDEAKYPKPFSELGFVFVDDGCGGTRPACEDRVTCPVFPERVTEWQSLATEGRRSPPDENRIARHPPSGRQRARRAGRPAAARSHGGAT